MLYTGDICFVLVIVECAYGLGHPVPPTLTSWPWHTNGRLDKLCCKPEVCHTDIWQISGL